MNSSPQFSLTSPDALVLFRRQEEFNLELLSYTFAELLLLGVIKLSQKRVGGTKENPIRQNLLMMSRGPNFTSFKGSALHRLFLHFLKKKSSVSVYHASCWILQRCTYSRFALANEIVRPDLKKKQLLHPGGDRTINLTKSPGKIFCQTARKYLAYSNQALPDLLISRKAESLRIFANLGPLVLTLPNLSFQELTRFAPFLKKYPSLQHFLLAYPPTLPIFRWGKMNSMPNLAIGKHLDELLNTYEGLFLREKESDEYGDDGFDYDL